MANSATTGTDRSAGGFPWWLLPLAAAWGYGAWLFSRLPASVPAHWNIEGKVDRYGQPWEAAFLLPGIMLAMSMLLYFVGRRNREMQLMSAAILGFMFCIHLVIGSSSLSGELPKFVFELNPIIAVIPLALSWGYGGWLYNRLPEVVPIHWGIHGEPDGFAGRAVGAFMLPGILTVMSAAMYAITRHAPLILVTVFLLVMQIVMSRIQLRYRPE